MPQQNLRVDLGSNKRATLATYPHQHEYENPNQYILKYSPSKYPQIINNDPHLFETDYLQHGIRRKQLHNINHLSNTFTHFANSKQFSCKCHINPDWSDDPDWREQVDFPEFVCLFDYWVGKMGLGQAEQLLGTSLASVEVLLTFCCCNLTKFQTQDAGYTIHTGFTC